MELISQNETLINLAMCVFIVIAGYVSYSKYKNPFIPYLLASFGLFGISHYFTYAGLAEEYESSLIVIRLVAYLLIILALLSIKNKGKK